jgi:hypothetical protein
MKRYSIVHDMRNCLICGRNNNLNIHEVFFGSKHRQLSIKYGCCVALCSHHHNMRNASVHQNREMNLKIKRHCQKKFVETYPELDFLTIFGRNYL